MKKKWIILIGVAVISLGLMLIGMNALSNLGQEPNQNSDLPQPLRGKITEIELGTDGWQVKLQTDYLLYSVTVSSIQTNIIGSVDQLKVGAEIEVSGQSIAGTEPPLIVADHLRILENSSPISDETWILTSYNGQNPLDGQQPTLRFTGDEFSGTTGCNQYGGSYQSQGAEILFEGIYRTEMACEEPEGIMGQEVIYLELLSQADRYQLNEDELTIFSGPDPILIFGTQSEVPVQTEAVPEEEPTPTAAPAYTAPEGFREYQDLAVGLSIYFPETWIITGVIEGDYAILQSYPEDKYYGGEAREEGDTKCDLNLNGPVTRVEDLVSQWEANEFATILSENDFQFPDGVVGKRFEIDSLGQSVTFAVEIESRLILLTCFGDFSMIDEIAATLQSAK